MGLFLGDSEPSKIFVGDTPISKVFLGDTQVRPIGWQPGANTLGYYTFDDQNANQITDFSGNNRNLTGGTMPSYTLVSGSNYAGVFSNVSSSNIAPSYSYGPMNGDYTILCWVKPTTNTASYVNIFYGGTIGDEHQISLIRGYNSGQFEYFDYTSAGSITKRTTIKAGASLNTWYLVGYTRNGTSVKTYYDGVNTNSITGNSSSYNKTFYLGSANVGLSRLLGQIGECIVENRVRTAQEIADYYNLTKSDYGL